MGYSLFDSNGYIGDVGTTGGLQDLRKYCLSMKKHNVRLFLDKGAALITEVFMNEVKALRPRKKTIQTTAENLLVLLERCEGVAIISDGVN